MFVLFFLAGLNGQARISQDTNDMSRISGGEARLSPQLINYQGYLTDSLGEALTDSQSMIFSIYDDETAGHQLWTETMDVGVDDGVFNALLGTVTPIPDSVFTGGTDRWLQVTVEGEDLSPRSRIASVGYAYTATYADTADYARSAPSIADGDWTISGSDMYSNVSGSVGIGTSSPSSKLDVSEVARVQGDDWPTTGAGMELAYRSPEHKGYVQVYDRDVDEWGDLYLGNGNVGIGTINPSHRLTVNGGDARILGGDGWDGLGDEAALYLGDSNSGMKAIWGEGVRIWSFAGSGLDIKFGNSAGANHMTMKMISGNVGIGTENPDNTLHVAGVTRTEGVKFPSSLAADSNYVGTEGNFMAFGHSLTSEDFLGYKSNTFYFKDSPGGGDVSEPNLVVGGKVGIGTDNPTEMLEVEGTIHSSSGGFKFPDGTVQTTAATGSGGNWSVADSVLSTNNFWGIARGGAGNTLSGLEYTQVNLGISSGTEGSYSTIGGGFSNTAGDNSTVSGGLYNNTTGQNSYIGGGFSNTANGYASTVCGGYQNYTDTSYTFIGGGRDNYVGGPYSTIGGGTYNYVYDYASVCGGDSNIAYSYGTIAGGGHVNRCVKEPSRFSLRIS
jgi:hypothetical protein